MAILYPMILDIKVHITNGTDFGSITYGCPIHKLPSEADMPAIIADVKKSLPDNFRLMSRHESMMYIMREKNGYRGPNIAFPSPDKGDAWHDPETASSFSHLFDLPENETDDED